MASAFNSREGNIKSERVDNEPRVVREENQEAAATVSSRSTGAPSTERREVLIRQPSYCKILNDLRGTEEKMKSEPPTNVVEVSTSAAEDVDDPSSSPTGAGTSGAGASSSSGVQTININGQQYQIVSPSVEGLQTITVGSGGGLGGVGSSSGMGATGSGLLASEEANRKREIRLLKNREVARECRNKKKEYIKCLENRVAVLENQNKALIEELKSLKELYTGQKN